MWNFWDKIYCINLDRRPDRWQECIKEFNRIGLPLEKVTRFSAIDMKHGGMGCYASHITVMEDALVNNYQRTLILEDDVMFLDEGLNNLSKAISYLQNIEWDVFFVGLRVGGNLYRITDYLYKPTQGSCTHAIGYTPKALRLCLNSLQKQFKRNQPPYYFVPIDSVGIYNYICSLQCFCSYPLVAVQRAGYSDLHNAFVDYVKDTIYEYNIKYEVHEIPSNVFET